MTLSTLLEQPEAWLPGDVFTLVATVSITIQPEHLQPLQSFYGLLPAGDDAKQEQPVQAEQVLLADDVGAPDFLFQRMCCTFLVSLAIVRKWPHCSRVNGNLAKWCMT